MARPLRIAIPDGLYHVIARGNNRDTVFRGERDFELFLDLLAHAVDRYGLLCHGYCLMTNHYHLILETPRANLPRGMRQLNGLYARRHNLRHGRCGHVFQARYTAILVEKESHLLRVCRYVDLNPVRAGICRDPADYRWSSHRATIGLTTPPRCLSTDWTLAQFGTTRRAAQAQYRAFVLDGIDDALAEAVRGQRLGTDALLRDTFGYDPPLAEIPREQIEPLPPSLDEIFTLHPTQAVFVAYRRHGYTIGAIADHLQCHYSTVSRRLPREETHEAVPECKT